jgi:hypothetical protein
MDRIAEVFGGAVEFSKHGGDPDASGPILANVKSTPLVLTAS